MRRSASRLLVAFAAAMAATSCRQEAVVGLRNDNSETGAPDPRPDASTSPPPPPPNAYDDCAAPNPAGLPVADIAKLLHGGDPGAVSLLYPYDGTVFPGRGAAPLVMWSGPAAEAVALRLRSRRFDFRICARPSGPNALRVPQNAWDAASAASGGEADPIELTLTTLAAGVANGPVTERVVIARGALPGSVYYTTVTPPQTGRIVRVTHRGEMQLFLGGLGCTGCHSASAGGTRFIAYSNGLGASFINASSSSPPTTLLVPTPGAEFAAVHPNGALYVSSANQPAAAAPRGYGATTQTAGLYDMDTGVLIPGSGIPPGAALPAFSPDGTRLAFNDVGATPGHTLAVMDFAPEGRTATNHREVFSDPVRYPAWPTFVPDNRALVFALGAAKDFSGLGLGVLGKLPPGPASDLFILDFESGAATMLHRAMGFEGAESGAPVSVLDTEELHQSYYPSVAPVTAGGYAWVFFDTYRSYGNLGAARAIWGAALSLSETGEYRADPSHPAFYVSGQDAFTANFRATAVLDPCLPNGAACGRGLECCGGQCDDGWCGTLGSASCAPLDGRCRTDEDCCGAPLRCLGNYCSVPSPTR